MPNIRALGLISGAVALIAIACGGDSTTSENLTDTGPTPTLAAPRSTVAPTPRLSPDPLTMPTPTPRPTLAGVGGKFIEVEPTGLVERDLDYEDALRSARFSIGGWKTDWSYHTVPYNDFLSGGPPRDGIRPIDQPEFVSIEEADK